MKSIMIVLVSIVIISGCKPIVGPIDIMGKGSNNNGSDNSGSSCYYYYKAIVQMRFENGDPCCDVGIAVISHSYYHADSAGFVEICDTVKCEEYTPTQKTYPYTVYDNKSERIIWEGAIQMIRYNEHNDEWPDQYIEIVISD